ncbi:zinc-dependent peptidase [Guyparkeria sp.]|uniref:M90 family metallopeptidase n=1 Tax=Guyparkeria sp. TaxID=2035736 RepID=UPI0039705ACE
MGRDEISDGTPRAGRPLSVLRWLVGLLPGGGAANGREIVVPEDLWRDVCRDQPELVGLGDEALRRLRQLAGRFLAGRPFYGGGEFRLDDARQLRIATLAALPVLELGLDWLDGIRSVVVYADAFHVDHEEVDEDGVVHHVRDLRAGEAWEHGTLVLSWADIEAGLDPGYATSVVVHEVAHFIDGVNGAENGFPPLPKGYDRSRWTRDFQAAFDRLNDEIDAAVEPSIDPYAATNPAEFFAVLSEYFFRLPGELRHFDAALYRHLAAFYRQDPLARQAA